MGWKWGQGIQADALQPSKFYNPHMLKWPKSHIPPGQGSRVLHRIMSGHNAIYLFASSEFTVYSLTSDFVLYNNVKIWMVKKLYHFNVLAF